MSASLKALPFKTKLFIALALVYTVWGSTYLAVHYAIQVLPPLFATAIRFGIGGGLLFIFTLFKGYKLPSKKAFMGSSYLGILLNGLGTSSVAFAIKYIPSGLVALLVAMLPLWTFLLDYFFISHLKPSKLSSVGLILGAFGMVFLLNPFDTAPTHSHLPIFPVVILFLGCISWAYGSLIATRLPQAPGIQTTAIQMMLGGVFTLFLSFFTESNQLNSLQHLTPTTLISMAYLIFIGSYIGYSAFVWLMNNAPPLLTSTYAYVNPIVAMFLGWLFANEQLSSQSLLASCIILLSVILMTLGRRKMKGDTG